MPHVVFVDSRVAGFRAIELAKDLGHQVSLVASEASQATYTSDRFEAVRPKIDRVRHVADAADPAALRRALVELDRERPVDGIVALPDEVLPSVATVARDVGVPFTAPEAIANARDKARGRELLRAHGLATVSHQVIEQMAELPAIADEIGYPVVVKLASGAGSLAASIVRDPGDLEHAMWKGDATLGALSDQHRAAFGTRLVVERFLDGPLISLEIAARDGHVVPLVLLERQRFAGDQTLELGSVAPARVPAGQATAVGEYAVDVVRALGLDFGMFHLEFILTAEGPVLIDPNPRLVGGPNALLVKGVWGYDIHEELIALQLGGPLPRPPGEPKCAGAAHVLAPRDDAVCRDALPDPPLPPDPRLVDWDLRVRPDQAVRQAISNFEYLGHVVALAETDVEAAEVAIAAVEQLGRTTGIPFLTWQPL
jgi:biotin carboxylase